MNCIKYPSNSQETIKVQNKITDFFNKFNIGTLMNRCGIKKHHGHSVRSLTEAIFILPFVGKNFFRGIVSNKDAPFGKDAAYDLLKGERFNWRNLLLCLAYRLFKVIDPLTGEDRESVFIIDDSLYDRSRSKNVELLSRVYDHCTGRYMKGFRLLTMCWSDGVSTLPVDFSLLSSSKPKNRFCESRKQMDKRCCASKRRSEATLKATDLLEPMVKRALSTGIRAKYLLMDSWFVMPAVVSTLVNHIHVIGRVKKTNNVQYIFDAVPMNVNKIYRWLKNHRGITKRMYEVVVTLKSGVPVKLVFVRNKNKSECVVLLSTDTALSGKDIVRIYGKRWDIEVFFKMSKQHLNLAKEIQFRDYDALIAHTTIVFMRYMFLSYQCRMETDHRTFGDLFYAYCDEIEDISFIESLYRLMTLAKDKLQKAGVYCEKTACAFFNTILDFALKNFGLSKNNFNMSLV